MVSNKISNIYTFVLLEITYNNTCGCNSSDIMSVCKLAYELIYFTSCLQLTTGTVYN